MLLGEDTVEIVADDVNVNNNIDYTEPEIPPLWEVLNVPGPPEAVKQLSEARQKRTQTAIIEAEVQKIEERELDLCKENLDIFTDNEFKQWRNVIFMVGSSGELPLFINSVDNGIITKNK